MPKLTAMTNRQPKIDIVGTRADVPILGTKIGQEVRPCVLQHQTVGWAPLRVQGMVTVKTQIGGSLRIHSMLVVGNVEEIIIEIDLLRRLEVQCDLKGSNLNITDQDWRVPVDGTIVITTFTPVMWEDLPECVLSSVKQCVQEFSDLFSSACAFVWGILLSYSLSTLVKQ